jgi:hypothetical protein
MIITAGLWSKKIQQCEVYMNDKYSRATVVIAVLMVICMSAICYGFYKLIFTSIAGQECAITLQFKDSKATYIGRTV